MAAPDADIAWDDEVEWDKPRAEPPAPAPVVDPRSQSGTALRSFGQGASLGFADVLRGLSGALQELGSRGAAGRLAAAWAPVAAAPVTGLGGMLAGASSAPELLTGSEQQLGDFRDLPLVEALIQRYRRDRDAQRADVRAGAKTNPKTAAAAEVAGALAVPMPKLAPGATLLQRMSQAGKTGALMGGAAALGASESEDPLQMARQVGGGAALGGGIGGVVPPVVEVGTAKVLKPAAERFANSQAVKALLGSRGLVNRLKDRLGADSEAGIQRLGSDVREAKLLGRFVPNSVGGVNEANQRMLATEGSRIGEVISEADDAARAAAQQSAQTGVPSFARVQPSATRAAYEAGVDEAAKRSGVLGELAPEVKPLGAAFENPNVTDYRTVWNTQSDLARGAFPTNVSRVSDRLKLAQAGQQAARENIISQLEQQVGPDRIDDLREASRRYSLGKRIESTVKDAAMREESSTGPGVRDMLTAGALSEPGLKQGLLASSIGLVRGRGNAAAALYAPRVASALQAAAPMVGAGGAVEAGMSTADPLGALRQYLEMSPEEQRQSDGDAFMGGGL